MLTLRVKPGEKLYVKHIATGDEFELSFKAGVAVEMYLDDATHSYSFVREKTKEKTSYQIELVWNREFDWCVYDTRDTLEEAIALAQELENSGDGARVKKTRIRNLTTNKTCWAYGKEVRS